jgi:peptidyl-prolyl cis-trans isomerase D
MTNGKSKFNSLAISILMGLIIVAFAFTGVTSLTNTGNKVASVGDKYVEGVEFNRAYQGMVNNMTQRNGGKSLTQKQLKLAGVQQRVAEQLISQKLLLIFAESLHFDAGKLAIKNTILTQYPAFKTNGKFDIIKYKGLLKANGIQVKDFESDVVNQIKMDKLNALFSSMQFSNSYAKDFVEFRNTEAKVMAISFDKEAMTKNIKVAKMQ